MALDQILRVTFTKVGVRREAPDWGPSEWMFAATVRGEKVGDPAKTFPAALKATIDLPDDEWSTEVDVSTLDSLDIVFAVSAQHEAASRDLGKVTLKLKFPFSEREAVLGNKYFAVTVNVELKVAGAYGGHSPDEIFASREVKGQTIWTTVSGRRFVPRLEFCEVVPAPPDAAMPPRPVQPPGVPKAKRNAKGYPKIISGDPINLIRNPSVIPMLDSAEASKTTCACIEYTFYRPETLNFTIDDNRLQWKATSLAGGASVDFIEGDKGLRVYVNGTKEGEVLLECSMEGTVLGRYRAPVRPMHDIVCRFNILNGPPGAIPRSTPENVQDHMKIANIFLRQLGLQLVLDTDPTLKDGAVATAIPGIFRISVGAGTTSGIALANFPRCSRLNYRPDVMNFAYIHSAVPLGPGSFVLGMATDIPANPLAPTVTDAGTPSTSWKTPSGIPPDKVAKNISMKLFKKQQRTGHPQLYAMYVTDNNGAPGTSNDMLTYAGTIAHELGHVLGLRHRVGAGHDGLLHPWDQNVMHGTNPSTIAQDFDIIQARAVIGSPAVT